APAAEPAAAAPAPAAPAHAPASGAAASGPATLKELKMMVTQAQEDFLLVFEPVAPAYTLEIKGQDSSLLEMAFAGTRTALGRKAYVPPQSGLFKSVKVAQE